MSLARIWTIGFESNDITIEGFISPSPFVTDTVTVRSGTYSLKRLASSTAARTASLAGALDRAWFLRVYYMFSALPASQISLMYFKDSGAANVMGLELMTDGTVKFGVSPNLQSTLPLAANVWHSIEMSYKAITGADNEFGARINEEFLFGTAAGSEAAPDTVHLFGTNTTITGWFDDIALNDDTGASQKSWPGPGKVVLLVPISDNARDTLWTGGVGGTSNLFDAVNNLPPTGTATETDATQIEHAGGAAGTTDRYDANMTKPETAGIRAADTVNTAHFIEADGEDIATGAKLLNFEVLSNPVIASPGNITAGNNIGALGTYPTNWTVRSSSPVYAPRLDVKTSPVMRARRPETASRVASVCFMGIYVDYTPGAMLPKQFTPVPFIPRGRNL